MSRWHKFRELTGREQIFLCFSVAGLAVVGALLRLAGFERTVAWLRGSSRRPEDRDPAAGALEWARRRSQLIAIAARRGPYRATCLPRSLLLWWIVRRRGLDPRLRIGVRRSEGELFAHAWIELSDEVLNDRAEIAQTFAAFEADRLPERLSWV